MKLINNAEMQTGKAAGFKFSGVRPDKLGATEYTLVTVVTDNTGSVSGFADELLQMKQAIVQACRKSPRASYLMLRQVEFNTKIVEVHGFVELPTIDETAYAVSNPYGSTALYDATLSAVAATNSYAKTLSDADYGVNGIVFVITDGDDNASSARPYEIAAEVVKGVQAEWLESLMVILVGVNASVYRQELEKFKIDAKLTQFVEVADATPGKLAKLANFVSRSISSQSQALGTGGPSQPLVF